MPAEWVLAAWARRRELKDDLDAAETESESLRESLDDAYAAVHAALLAADAAREAFAEAETARRRLHGELSALPLVFDPEVIATLPVEMLQAIFRALAFEADPLWSNLDKGQYNPMRALVPWRLAAVCQRWRKVALDMPEIWTYIAVPPLVAENYKGNGENLLTRTKALLQRSASRPLDILLVCEDSLCRLRNLSWFQKLLMEIAQCASRWRRVRFTLPIDVDEWDLLFLRQPTPLLEEVYVSICSGIGLPWKERYPSYLPSPPLLRTLWINAVFAPPRSPLMSLTSAHLAVDSRSQTCLWNALCCMPMLEFLGILFRSSQNEILPAGSTPHLRLRSLKSLELSGFFSRINAWSTALDMPHLERLTLRANSTSDIFGLQILFPVACSSIVELFIDSYTTAALSISFLDIQAFRVCTRIRRLVLRKCKTNNLFAELNRSPLQLVWPELNTVVVKLPSPGDGLEAFCDEILNFLGYRVDTRHYNNGGSSPFTLSIANIALSSLGDSYGSAYHAVGYVLGPSNCRFTDTEGQMVSLSCADETPSELADFVEAEFTDTDDDSRSDVTDSSSGTNGDDDGADGHDSGTDRVENAGEGGDDYNDGGNAAPSDDNEVAAPTMVVSGARWDSDRSDDSDYDPSDSSASDEEPADTTAVAHADA